MRPGKCIRIVAGFHSLKWMHCRSGKSLKLKATWDQNHAASIVTQWICYGCYDLLCVLILLGESTVHSIFAMTEPISFLAIFLLELRCLEPSL